MHYRFQVGDTTTIKRVKCKDVYEIQEIGRSYIREYYVVKNLSTGGITYVYEEDLELVPTFKNICRGILNGS